MAKRSHWPYSLAVPERQPGALLQASSSCFSFPSWPGFWPHWTLLSGCTLASHLPGGCTVLGFTAAVVACEKHIMWSSLESPMLDGLVETNLMHVIQTGACAAPFLPQRLSIHRTSNLSCSLFFAAQLPLLQQHAHLHT